MLSLVLCLAIVVQVVYRIGTAHAEEESSRLDAVLARPVGRLRWLSGHVLLAAGAAGLSLSDTVSASLNTSPVVALLAGLSIGLFGMAPRFTVSVPTVVILAGFVLYLLGPALDWPTWALNLSPFTHLAMVPAEPWRGSAALAMTGIGAVLGGVGALGFRRRDITPG